MNGHSDPSVLQVGVVGAGIAGLGAAIALRRAGHEVDIYEKSSFKQELGAAITMTPNGNKVLEKWGFDAKKAMETEKMEFRILDHSTLEVQLWHDFHSYRNDYGAAFNAFHRVDMHEQMRSLAVAAGAKIHLSSKVGGIDCAKGEICLGDGIVKKDLIVIADGVKSSFVDQITGACLPNKRTGKSVYRCLVPMDKLMADPVTKQLFDGKPSGQLGSFVSATGTLIVNYPCREDQVLNVAIFHATKPHQIEADDWNSPATIADVLDVLPGCHPAWTNIIKHTESVAYFTLGDRDTAPRMNRGKAVLIGDASHPMQPTHGAGGNMAVEDAAALEVLFSNWSPSTDNVEKRLELLNRIRLPRNNVTQLLSNAMFYARDPEEKLLARVREYFDGRLPAPDSMGWGRDLADFFSPYDVFNEAAKAMKYKDDPASIPDGTLKYFW